MHASYQVIVDGLAGVDGQGADVARIGNGKSALVSGYWSRCGGYTPFGDLYIFGFAFDAHVTSSPAPKGAGLPASQIQCSDISAGSSPESQGEYV